MSGCPHIERPGDCPLYLLSHYACWSGYGCIDGHDVEPCRVKRGAMDFDRGVDRANEHVFGLLRERIDRRAAERAT